MSPNSGLELLKNSMCLIMNNSRKREFRRIVSVFSDWMKIFSAIILPKAIEKVLGSESSSGVHSMRLLLGSTACLLFNLCFHCGILECARVCRFSFSLRRMCVIFFAAYLLGRTTEKPRHPKSKRL